MEPFLPMLKWARGHDGTLAFGCPANYKFEVRRPGGSVIRVSRTWEPPRNSRDEQVFFSGTPNRGPIPDTKPAYHRIWVTDDGRIWVWPGRPGVSIRRPEYAEHGWPTTIWDYYSATDGFDVFEQSGRWLGHVETPANWWASPLPGHQDPLIRGDTVWAVTSDEWGAHYLKKFVVDWENPVH